MINIKHKKIKNQSSHIILDKEEQVLEDALMKGEYISVKDIKKSRKMFEEAAKTYVELHKSKRVTIRINRKDLLKVKIKARKSGIPYQTLLGVLIHEFAEGQTKVEI